MSVESMSDKGPEKWFFLALFPRPAPSPGPLSCGCRVKPIFHCNAKLFALGTFASHNAKIPTYWYLLRLIGDANFSKTPQRVGFQTQNTCVGHVHFTFFVSISFALGSQFSVEYGL